MILNTELITSTTCVSVVQRNLDLLKNGVKLLPINIIGESGIGKSEVVKHACVDYGIIEKNVQLQNLAELSDPADLLGMPGEYINVEIYLDDSKEKTKTVPMLTKLVSTVPLEKIKNIDYSSVHSSYAPPIWVKETWKAHERGEQSVLILDDLSRANSYILQGIMELLNQRKYGTWTLPKDTLLICTSNPDNGKYDVQSIGPAFRSRSKHFVMQFNLKEWLSWAETQEDIDKRILDWISANSELFNNEVIEKGAASENICVLNARTLTGVARAIKGLTLSKEDMNMISYEVSSSIGSEAGNSFMVFLNTFGALPSADKILESESEEQMISLVIDCIHSKLEQGKKVVDLERRNPLIEHILIKRCLNYIKNLEVKDTVVASNFKVLLLREDLLSQELVFNVVKQLNKFTNSKTAQLLSKDPKVVRLLSKSK